MKLIDKDALKPDYIVASTTTNTPCYRYYSEEQINNAPTIDAVQVVKCKDCINWFQEREDELGWCGMNDDCTPPGWFCADGESRTEVEE